MGLNLSHRNIHEQKKKINDLQLKLLWSQQRSKRVSLFSTATPTRGDNVARSCIVNANCPNNYHPYISAPSVSYNVSLLFSMLSVTERELRCAAAPVCHCPCRRRELWGWRERPSKPNTEKWKKSRVRIVIFLNLHTRRCDKCTFDCVYELSWKKKKLNFESERKEKIYKT